MIRSRVIGSSLKAITRAVLFDLDGTCIDTETISTKAIQLALDPFDKHIDWTLKKKLLGLRGVDWATIVVEEHGIQSQLSPEALVRQWEANLKALYAEAHLLPGVQRLVEHLHKHQVPMAICTSSSAAAVAAKRQHHEAFFSYFPVIVTGDDPAVTRGKPAPVRLSKDAMSHSCHMSFASSSSSSSSSFGLFL